MLEIVVALIWLLVIPGFALALVIEHERGERARAQLHQYILDKGGFDVSVISDTSRRFQYAVKYQDGKGYLYRAKCRVEFIKGQPNYSWTSVSKVPLYGGLTAEYGQLHEELKLLRVKYGDELFVEMSDKERAVWEEVNNRQDKGEK